MSKPSRTPDLRPANERPRTFFVTTRTAGGKALFQTDQMASLFVDVLRSNVKSKKFNVHAFVVMPNHVHVLLTLPGAMTVEKAMQLIKGGFSYRANKELGFKGEVWQRGFSDVRVSDEQSFNQHRGYIDSNPVKSGLATLTEDYRFGSAHLMKQMQAGAKAQPILEHLRHD